MACHVTVLGDSSSSGIGLGRDCYPARLARILSRDLDVAVFNSAVPGFTSGDASRYFHAIATHPHDYVIIYLGNNEGAVGARKGYYGSVRARVTEALSGAQPREFRPVLSPTRFRFSYDVPAARVVTTPTEFRDNLRSIVRRATRAGAEVIILNPIANRRFPCGVGATNSSYFCYLDRLDQFGDPVVNQPRDEASAALAAGLGRFTVGEFQAAVAAWQPLVAINNVAGYIARHNVACAAARLGDGGSEAKLTAMLGEYAYYDSTILYNLAGLKGGQGDRESAEHLLDRAFEADASLYRIRQEYRQVIEAFAQAAGVRVLDLAPILTPHRFVDYCHPTGEGHEEIARALADLIRADGHPPPGAEASRYEVVLPTPDYLHQPGQTLVDYYCVDWPIPPARIAAAWADLRDGVSGSAADGRDDDIHACVANFVRSNSDHPAFSEPLTFRDAWTPRSYEVLSCPEQFMYRVLYNYSLAFEKSAIGAHLSAGSDLDQVRLAAEDYRRIILRSTEDDLEAELDTTREYLDAIMGKIAQRLRSAGPMYRVTLGQRIRTIMTWFTREALRYGTQSRLSMLYARWDIEKIVEGLIVAVVIADTRGDERELRWLDAVLSHVLSLIQVHERHAGLYHRDDPSFSADGYQAELARFECAAGTLLQDAERSARG